MTPKTSKYSKLRYVNVIDINLKKYIYINTKIYIPDLKNIYLKLYGIKTYCKGTVSRLVGMN